jgi:hypothetical protein
VRRACPLPESGLVSGAGGRRPSESAAYHLKGRCGDSAGRERATVADGGGIAVARAAEERRHAANYSADNPAHDAAGAVKNRPYRLAGSPHDAAHRPDGAPRVDRAWRRLGMNDDLTTLAVMGVVAIAGLRATKKIAAWSPRP